MTGYLACADCQKDIRPGEPYERRPVDRPDAPPVIVHVHAPAVGCRPAPGTTPIRETR